MATARNLSPLIISYLSLLSSTGSGLDIKGLDLMQALEEAPLEEIKFLFNSISDQKMWEESLVNIFYEALLKKLHDSTYFVLYTLSEVPPGGVDQWLRDSPSMVIHLGESLSITVPSEGVFSINSNVLEDSSDAIINEVLFNKATSVSLVIKNGNIHPVSIGNIKISAENEKITESAVSVPLFSIIDSDIILMGEMISRLSSNNLNSVLYIA